MRITSYRSKLYYHAPGRVHLIGEQLEDYGVSSLSLAINYGTSGTVTLRNDFLIELFSCNFSQDGALLLDLTEPIKKTGRWFDYPLGVIAAFQQAGYTVEQGFSLQIRGHLPFGAGLASSASLTILFAYLLNDVNQLGLSRLELAMLAHQAETVLSGDSCELTDHLVIAHAEKAYGLWLNPQKRSFDLIPCDFTEETGEAFALLVLDSNVKRGRSLAVDQDRRREWEQAWQIAESTAGVSSFSELTTAHLKQLKRELSPVLWRRLRHGVSEQYRAQESVKALRVQKIRLLGELMYHSHKSLAKNVRVSFPELDFIVSASKQLGAVGARMTGGCFGGSVIALIAKKDLAEFCETIDLAYQEEFDLPLDCYVVSTSDGVQKRAPTGIFSHKAESMHSNTPTHTPFT